MTFSGLHRTLAIGATLAALVAGPATAAQYIATLHVDQVGPDVPSTVDISTGYQDHSATVGVTKTNYTVGASAYSANGGTLSASLQVAPIDAHAAADHATVLYGDSTAVYTFTFNPVNGVAGTDLVPVHVSAQGGISWNNSGSAESIFRLSDYVDGAIINKDVSRNANGANTYIQGTDGFTVDQTLLLDPTRTYSVVLYSYVYADARGINTGTYGEDYASVDPVFTIQGDFASRYTLVGIPSDAPPPPPPPPGGVPEPASWALMITGFGLAGLSLRRRAVRLTA